jgi:hypothetical protein
MYTLAASVEIIRWASLYRAMRLSSSVSARMVLYTRSKPASAKLIKLPALSD